MKGITLIGFVVGSLIYWSTLLAQEPPKPDPSTEILEKSKSLEKEGKAEEALALLDKSWKETSDKNFLKMICVIHLRIADFVGLDRYIDDIVKNAKGDMDLLKVAYSYALQTGNEKVFWACIPLTDQKMVMTDQSLASGIAIGTVKFYKPDGLPKK